MKCMVCGLYSAVSLCVACRYTMMFYLLSSADALDALDARMTCPGLDINEPASAASSAHRAQLAGWAMVCAEETARTPEIDRQLSSPRGQAALITQRLSDTTPEWATDCVREITHTYLAITALLVV